MLTLCVIDTKKKFNLCVVVVSSLFLLLTEIQIYIQGLVYSTARLFHFLTIYFGRYTQFLKMLVK